MNYVEVMICSLPIDTEKNNFNIYNYKGEKINSPQFGETYLIINGKGHIKTIIWK